MPEETSLVERGPQEVAPPIDFGADAGAGTGDIGERDIQFPHLILLQSGSPQKKRSDPAYVEGAEEGDAFLTVQDQTFPVSSKPLRVVICHFRSCVVETTPEEPTGKWVGEHEPDAPIVLASHRTEKGTFAANGNRLIDTYYYLVLVLTEDGPVPAIWKLKSTQLGFGRRLNSKIKALRIRRSNGATIKAPMFSHVWPLGSEADSNDRGSWFAWKLEAAPELIEDAELYNAARSLHEVGASGSLRNMSRKDPEAAEAESTDGGSTPF